MPQINQQHRAEQIRMFHKAQRTGKGLTTRQLAEIVETFVGHNQSLVELACQSLFMHSQGRGHLMTIIKYTSSAEMQIAAWQRLKSLVPNLIELLEILKFNTLEEVVRGEVIGLLPQAALLEEQIDKIVGVVHLNQSLRLYFRLIPMSTGALLLLLKKDLLLARHAWNSLWKGRSCLTLDELVELTIAANVIDTHAYHLEGAERVNKLWAYKCLMAIRYTLTYKPKNHDLTRLGGPALFYHYRGNAIVRRVAQEIHAKILEQSPTKCDLQFIVRSQDPITTPIAALTLIQDHVLELDDIHGIEHHLKCIKESCSINAILAQALELEDTCSVPPALTQALKAIKNLKAGATKIFRRLIKSRYMERPTEPEKDESNQHENVQPGAHPLGSDS